MDRHTDPQYRSEDGCALRIWRDTAQNNFLSEENGRPVFDEVIYVEVIAPGSGNSTPVFEVVRYLAKEAHQKEPKYGNQYARFKKFVDDFISDEKSDASLSGTPLAQWPEMTRTMVAELKAQKIFTVDALAALPDAKLGAIKVPEARTWREKAKAYLEAAKSSSYATGLAAQLAEAQAEKVDLQRQITELAARLDAQDAAKANTGGANAAKTTAKAKGELAPAVVVDPNAAPVAVAAEGETLVAADTSLAAAELPPII